VPGMQLDQIAHQIVADDPERGDWPVTYYQTHRDRFIGDVTLVPSLVAEHGRILEIGSSPPFVTAALSQRGYDVAGVDIAPDRFAGSIARFGLEVHACDIEQERLPFDSDTFDLVLMNEVFEHLRINPIFTCSEVLRVLRPGGRLMLSTPNLWSLRGIFRFLVLRRAYAACADPYEEFSKLATIGHMGHVREYTTREVRSFLTRVGFDVERVIYRGRSRFFPERILTMMFPWWRHYFSVVAAKPKAPVDA
jgi:SAM-dependent methyltransferase